MRLRCQLFPEKLAAAGPRDTYYAHALDASTDVVFQVVDAQGNRNDRVVRPVTVNAAGTLAQVRVPLDAVTGQVRVVGDVNASSVLLQIVPRFRSSLGAAWLRTLLDNRILVQVQGDAPVEAKLAYARAINIQRLTAR